MRKPHTSEWGDTYKRSKREPSNWREAAKEVFDDVPGAALNLRGLRNREGLSQKKLGEAIGVEQSNISKMERGERQISPRIAKRLEKIFDIDYRLFL
ncbi:MAG: helix-turn-helix domain-containing protein [Parachlamydiaceae bacterium]